MYNLARKVARHIHPSGASSSSGSIAGNMVKGLLSNQPDPSTGVSGKEGDVGALMNLPLALLALILAPLGLLGAFGIVMLVLKIAAIVSKASEPPTEDRSTDYTLEQGKEIGRGGPPKV